MYNFFVVRITNRTDGTAGKTVKEYETEAAVLLRHSDAAAA